MKKRSLSFLMAVCLVFCSFATSAYASPVAEDVIEHTDMGPAVRIGSATNFPVRPYAMRDVLFEKEFTKQNTTFYYLAIDMGSYNVHNKFVRYLTDAWAKTDSYTRQSQESVSASLDLDVAVVVTTGITASLGLSTSVSKTFGVDTVVHADSSRYSKLGLTADYFVQTYDYTYKMDGRLITHKAGAENWYPTGEIYLAPMYQ